MRRLVLALCVALALASSAAAAPVAVDRGLILKVRPPRFVLRELDGTRVRFAVRRSTTITLDGRRVRLAQLRRGDVAVVTHNGQIATSVMAIRP